MRTCFQFEDMSVLDHGKSVAAWYRDLHSHLIDGEPLKLNWRLPDWIVDPIIPGTLLDLELMQMYQTYHDCGKPFCRTVDENGRQHFPGHAEVSRRRWLECADRSEAAMQIADLIGMDMDIHLLKSDGIKEFANRKEAISLLLTGLAEIHSNAEMFGGVDSIGFKIKWKHLDRTGRRILARLHAHSQAQSLVC